MTTPAQPQRQVVVSGISVSRILLIIGTVLFILAAFAAGGHPLADIGAWSWGFGGFAAWMLSGAL